MIAKLEALGFSCFNTRRIGPCDRCEKQLQTYYIPEDRKWYCEACYYSFDENSMFINFLLNGFNRKTQMPTLEERLQALEEANKAKDEEIAQLKSRSTDNVFVGTTGNLTLKHRQLNQRGWGVPTKNQNGQGFLRCGDFPMGYFLNKDNTAIILHQEIPATPREIQVFTQQFLKQNMVVAKRRQQTEGTPETPPTSTISTPSPTQTPAVEAGWKSLTSLSDAERSALIEEAKGLFAGGMYKSLPEAVAEVKTAHKVK